MLWNKGDQAIATRNLNLACAFITCGVPYHIERMVDDSTGREVCHFHLSAAADPELTKSPHQTAEQTLQLSTAHVLQALRAGELERIEPTHPVLDVLAGLHIRECHLSFMEHATSFQCVPIIGTDRHLLQPGPEPLRQRYGLPGFRVIRTNDLNLSCALTRCGFPMLEAQGTKPDRLFVHPRFPGSAGMAPPTGSEAAPSALNNDALLLAQAIQSGALQKESPDHPALWVLAGCENRAALLTELKHGRQMVLIRDPRSTAWVEKKRCSLVLIGPEGVNKKAFDAALKFNRKK